MATVRKIQPVGIDKVVDQLQDNLETLGWSNYEIYSRAYKNETEDGIIAEIYTGNEEYQEIFFDDTKDATSFFISDDTQEVTSFTQRVDGGLGIIFQVKSVALKPNITHRSDEELHYDVLNALRTNVPQWITTEVVTGISNVYAGLNTEKMQFTDIGNYHVFRVNLTGGYSVNCNVNTDGCSAVFAAPATVQDNGPGGIEIQWVMTTETSVTNYEVQRDIDAAGFIAIGNEPGISAGAYAFTDLSGPVGTVISYRVVANCNSTTSPEPYQTA